jgi:1,2-phenylacetyl-CoA epoxidase catalytic subunit
MRSSPGSSLAPPRRITLVKVFSATTARARAVMGEQITAWLARHPSLEVVDTVLTASSDRAFHCLSIVLLCEGGDGTG